MYELDPNALQRILTYSDIHEVRLEKYKVFEYVKKMNLYKSFSIVCELLSLRNKSVHNKDQFLWWQIDINISFDAMKNFYKNFHIKRKLSLQSNAHILLDPLIHPEIHILSLQSLLISLKLLIAYGDYSTLLEETNIVEDDYISVIKLSLMSIELLDHNDFKTDHFLYGNYHLNQINNIGSELLRAYYVFYYALSQNSLLSENVQREYLDFDTDFTKKYGYNIVEYLSVVFLLSERDVDPNIRLSYIPIYRDINIAYLNTTHPENAKKIIYDLSNNIDDFKEWAQTTALAWWDFSLFMEKPILMLPNGLFISICDRTLINGFYEKLYWHIRNCYPDDSKRFLSFISRPYENYLQLITEKAISKNKNYRYIEEFEFTTRESSNNASSDAYIILKDKLFIIEAKSFMPLFDSVNYCDDDSINMSISKLFIKPILQADKATIAIFNSNKKDIFKSISEVIILSITVDSIQAVPNYINRAINEINSNKTLPNLKYFYNLSIHEYECLLSMVENNKDIYKIIESYLNQKTIQPFLSFATEFYNHNIVRTSYMEDFFLESTKVLGKSLFNNI